MPPRPIVVEEEVVGNELHIKKPMRFKVSVPYQNFTLLFKQV